MTGIRSRPTGSAALACAAVFLASAFPAGVQAQDETDAGATLELYGQVMLDAGYRVNAFDPDYYDAMRPTRLPAFEGEFEPGGQSYFSVRQSRLGVRSSASTALGDLYGIFEFDLYGVGANAGQTTFRLRYAYAELGQFGAGQTTSPFMDIDVFPTMVGAWGPSGMVFFRNIQVRWMPIQGESHLTFALERPGASGDLGEYDDRIELAEVRSRFPYPDFSADYRHAMSWGYVELAGILRWIEWVDTGEDEFDLSGDVLGWGLNLSSNVWLGDADVLRLQLSYGEGIENYMNDASVDVGIVNNPGDPVTPVTGEALPVLGIVAFLDHTWSERFTSSIGFSLIDIENTPQQRPEAFSSGHYAVGNLLYSPVENVTVGAEMQYGRRENAADGFTSDDLKIEFAFRYIFSHEFGPF